MVLKFVSPQTSYVESLTPKEMVLGSGGFDRWLGYEGTAFMNGTGALTERPPRTLLPPLPG